MLAVVDTARYEMRLSSNQAYSHMEQSLCQRIALIIITTLEVTVVALQGYDNPYSESNLSNCTMCLLLGANFWVLYF